MGSTSIDILASARLKSIYRFLKAETHLERITGVLWAMVHERRLRRQSVLIKAFHSATENAHISAELQQSVLASAFAKADVSILHDTAKVALGYLSWKSARQTNDVTNLLEHMQDRIDVVRKTCARRQQYFVSQQDYTPYESRINRFTPGLNFAAINNLAKDILEDRERLQNTPHETNVSEMLRHHKFVLHDVDQSAVLQGICAVFGYNTNKLTLIGKQDLEPFCFVDNGHMTILYKPHQDDFVQTVLDVLHEFGHGLLRAESERNVRASFASLYDSNYNGPDEACALLMEQYIGRSPEFAALLQRVVFEETGQNINLDDLKLRLGNDTGSLNRASAHPSRAVLFHLAYTQLEEDIIDGNLNACDLQERWKEVMQRFLGREPDGSFQESVFQDAHWISGEFGRFPAGYFTGHLMGAQLYDSMLEDSSDIMNRLALGSGIDIVQWFKAKIGAVERQDHFDAFMQKTTGRALGVESFLRSSIGSRTGLDHQRAPSSPQLL